PAERLPDPRGGLPAAPAHRARRRLTAPVASARRIDRGRETSTPPRRIQGRRRRERSLRLRSWVPGAAWAPGFFSPGSRRRPESRDGPGALTAPVEHLHALELCGAHFDRGDPPAVEPRLRAATPHVNRSPVARATANAASPPAQRRRKAGAPSAKATTPLKIVFASRPISRARTAVSIAVPLAASFDIE